ncbi:hypothetical protein BKA62DRAFT_685510, partial [Auriculariales sp. MPI-PUGE-AT-0066]
MQFKEVLATDQLQALLEESSASEAQSKPRDTQINKRGIVLSIIWMHHLLSETKRSDIISLATRYKLTGLSKPGYPGCVIIEGDAPDVEAYISELRSWRWQAFQVRAEQQAPSRRLGCGGDLGGIDGDVWSGIR